jgi:putative transposase
MRYRWVDVAGGASFFTANLVERNRTLLVDDVDVLRSVIREVKAKHPFHIDAMVILPDHLHALWTLPVGNGDYPTRWMLIKAGFSQHIPRRERRNASRMTKGKHGIWQRRYWEHLIRDDRDYERYVDYIHFHPVKHGYVARALDWPHSSFHRYIAMGMLSRNWGVGVQEDQPQECGEHR